MPRQRVHPNKGTTSSRSKSSVSVDRQKASFLAIPIELRQEIYQYLIYPTSTGVIDLLMTNQQIAKEVKPFLYKRPPPFDGQYQLFEWLDSVDHEYLPDVAEISIKLVDIDPETIVGALGRRLREAKANMEPLRSGPQDNPYYEACYQDLKQMQKAFSLLTGVRHLTIIEAEQGDPQPPMPMLDKFSKMLGNCFPNLQSITSMQPLFPVHFIANKPKLRRLRFPANSQSSEAEVAAVCRKFMPNLLLEVYRHDPLGDTNQYEWGCMTEVLSNIPPVGGLSLVEDLSDQSSDLLDEVFVDSIETMKRHLRSMRTLTIMADPPDEPQKAALMKRNFLRFLESSNLRQVEVLGTYSSVYRHLPSSTEKFVLRLDRWCCDTEGSLSHILDEFMQHVKFRAVNKDPQIPRLSNLRSIEVWVHDHDDVFDPEDEEEDGRALEAKIKAQLLRIGVHFKLVIIAQGKEGDDR